MQQELVDALRAQRAQIRGHWEALLRVEPVSSPLARPETLVHLIDWSIDEVFSLLLHRSASPAGSTQPPPARSRAVCHCGNNPLLAHFIAGEQALVEALVLVQVATPGVDAGVRTAAVTELYHAVRTVARREVGSFCALCQHPAVSNSADATSHAGRV